jgi:hypothetical protein
LPHGFLAQAEACGDITNPAQAKACGYSAHLAQAKACGEAADPSHRGLGGGGRFG